jgi:hypothetical protein
MMSLLVAAADNLSNVQGSGYRDSKVSGLANGRFNPEKVRGKRSPLLEMGPDPVEPLGESGSSGLDVRYAPGCARDIGGDIAPRTRTEVIPALNVVEQSGDSRKREDSVGADQCQSQIRRYGNGQYQVLGMVNG